jgi:hypothetical protein
VTGLIAAASAQCGWPPMVPNPDCCDLCDRPVRHGRTPRKLAGANGVVTVDCRTQ